MHPCGEGNHPWGHGRNPRGHGHSDRAGRTDISYNILIELDLVLNVFPADAMLPPSSDRRVCEVDITIITIEFGHTTP